MYNLLSSKARGRKTAKSTSDIKISFEQITDTLRNLSADSSGIMIVHSSMSALATTNLTSKEICFELMTFLGSEGTLAMPAIPVYREEPKGPARLDDDICSNRITYNVRRSPVGTGAIPKALMSIPGAVRSRHPLNSMVAVGPLATSMMENNIQGSLPLPCGPHSSWKFCVDHDAKIVCLGVDSSHSLTMIHVVEDCWPHEWPVANWYRQRLFHVKDGDFEADITVLERRPHWSMYYAERTLQKDLLRLGIIQVKNVCGIRIEVCSSARLVDFLRSRRPRSYPYWIPN